MDWSATEMTSGVSALFSSDSQEAKASHHDNLSLYMCLAKAVLGSIEYHSEIQGSIISYVKEHWNSLRQVCLRKGYETLTSFGRYCREYLHLNVLQKMVEILAFSEMQNVTVVLEAHDGQVHEFRRDCSEKSIRLLAKSPKRVDLASPSSEIEDTQTAVRTVEKSMRGMTTVPSKGDGNCLYRSIANGLFGDQKLHRQVREAVMDYMSKHWEDDLGLFAFDNRGNPFPSLSSYFDHRARLGSFGGAVEAQAAARHYGVTIVVHGPFDVMPYGPSDAKQTIHLKFSGHPFMGHFDLLLPSKQKDRSALHVLAPSPFAASVDSCDRFDHATPAVEDVSGDGRLIKPVVTEREPVEGGLSLYRCLAEATLGRDRSALNVVAPPPFAASVDDSDRFDHATPAVDVSGDGRLIQPVVTDREPVEDGLSLYRCLAEATLGSGDYHPDIQRYINDYLEKHWDDVILACAEQPDFKWEWNPELKRMQSEESQKMVEMQAFSELEEIAVVIHAHDGKKYEFNGQQSLKRVNLLAIGSNSFRLLKNYDNQGHAR